MRIAAIDIGTNSIHMVIARANPTSGFQVLDREREVVQIGRGSWERGRLRAEAMRRSVDSLARFVALARRHQVDHVLCTATAAVREAANGGEFLRAAREATGISPRVIPAEEEGRLIQLAVASALELPRAPALIVDIGGGSMQLVLANRDRCLGTWSCPLGALRLTERFLDSDPPSRRDLERLRRHVRKQSREAIDAVREADPVAVYGSSGTLHALATAAAALDRGPALQQVNGHVLERDSLERLARALLGMTRAERERLPGIDASRAEIIVPGALVLLHVLERLGADAITLSDYGVREGLVTDYVQSHPRELSSIGRAESVRLRSVLQLLARFQLNERHARHVARLSLALFDGLKPQHGLDDGARELLHYAALLHDVGAVLGYDRHGEHSAYFIRHGNLRGLSATEIECVANVARFHGGRRPRRRELAAEGLRRPDRRVVRWLAAMLRVAEGLDRSHYQLVRTLRVTSGTNGITLRVTTRRDARLELWAARERLRPLSRLLGRPVRIAEAPAVAAAKAATTDASPAASRGRVIALRGAGRRRAVRAGA